MLRLLPRLHQSPLSLPSLQTTSCHVAIDHIVPLSHLSSDLVTDKCYHLWQPQVAEHLLEELPRPLGAAD